MKYKKYIALTLSIFVLFCFLGIPKEADACRMKNGKKGVTVNGQCVRFSSSGCGNFNLNSGHYGASSQCALLRRNCPPPPITPPPTPPPVCIASTICKDGKDLSILRLDCSTGSISCFDLGCKVGTSVCNTTVPAVAGECLKEQNQCKTNFGVDLNTPADDTGTGIAKWSCLGSNGGKPDSCSFKCPSGQTVALNVCTTTVVGSCTPVITATQKTKIVNPGNTCSIDWSYNVVNAGGADCAKATTECRLDGLDGVVVTPPNTTFDIGTHTLTCKTTLGANSWSATLNPSPQCRLNPYYTEF